MNTKIYNLILLDESSSLNDFRDEVITGFNESVQIIKSAQRKYPDQHHYVTFVTFNNEEVKTIFNMVRADRVAEIDSRMYHPGSGIPLYDALGKNILHLKQKIDQDADHRHRVLVSIITDGVEAGSRSYASDKIRDLVESLQKDGWIFTYMGANHDAGEFARTISIGNSLNWESTKDGIGVLNEKSKKARLRIYERIAQNPTEDLNIGYFDQI